MPGQASESNAKYVSTSLYDHDSAQLVVGPVTMHYSYSYLPVLLLALQSDKLLI